MSESVMRDVRRRFNNCLRLYITVLTSGRTALHRVYLWLCGHQDLAVMDILGSFSSWGSEAGAGAGA